MHTSWQSLNFFVAQQCCKEQSEPLQDVRLVLQALVQVLQTICPVHFLADIGSVSSASTPIPRCLELADRR
jgi:hypothetical protein